VIDVAQIKANQLREYIKGKTESRERSTESMEADKSDASESEGGIELATQVSDLFDDYDDCVRFFWYFACDSISKGQCRAA
jgi:hypothetical protein